MRPFDRDPTRTPTTVPSVPGAALAMNFDAIYDAHFAYVCRLVARLSGHADVDDLVQDVFMVVHRRLPTFEGRAQVSTWLFRIAYRVVGANIRRERRSRTLRKLLGRETGSRETPPVSLRLLEDAEQARTVTAALDALSWKKRTVLVMFEVEEWSCQQIADALQIPVKTVHTRLHHARHDLARLLGSDLGADLKRRDA
jgi:RNA polymerase sigma-70 factor (ECF subfamily)